MTTNHALESTLDELEALAMTSSTLSKPPTDTAEERVMCGLPGPSFAWDPVM
jgi:hypothetical protein